MCSITSRYKIVLYFFFPLKNLKNYDSTFLIKKISNSIKFLKKGGYLVINVPAFSFLYSNFDKDVGHYRRYSKSDFKKVLEGLNFQKANFIYFDTIGFFLSLLSKFFISNYRKNFDKKIKFWNSMIWISKIIDLVSFRCLGKSLLVIIKK